MSKLTPFLLAICALLSCQEPLEKQVVGHWVSPNFVAQRRDFYNGNRWTDTMTVRLTFLKGGRLVTETDTLDMIYKDDGFAYDMEGYKTRKPEDEWYTLQILDISDSTMKVVFFWNNDTVNLKRKEITHPNIH